jgi:hypothetical protein
MAVTAAFSAEPVEGLIAPSHQVQFTDESFGNPNPPNPPDDPPDRWLWDFGDGEYSDEQNPLHTYEGEAGDKFTVTLTVWIFASETVSSGGSLNRRTKVKSANLPNAESFAAFQALSYGGNSQEAAAYLNHRGGDNYGYLGAKRLRSNALLAALGSADIGYFVQAKRVLSSDLGPFWDLDAFAGQLQITVETAQVKTISMLGADANYVTEYDISNKAGAGFFDWTHEPVELILPETDNLFVQGIQALFRIMKYTATAEENIDSEIKVDYIEFATPPIAAFTASPTVGANPLTTQFNNTSTEAIGVDTTWSWKKRLSGSGDSFVEFSTEKHPSEIFTK